MRRGLRAGLIAAATAVVLAATGCGGGPTVGDGVLGLDWSVMPKPVVPTPKPDVCYPGVANEVDWDLSTFGSTPVACIEEHQSETFHVGTLAADDSVDRPEVGDDLFREAYEACAKEAKGFLGGDFHTARVAIVPVMPTERQWRGEARWYRCEMLETKDAWETIVSRKASLRDGLRGSRPAAITCANDNFDDKSASGNNVVYVSCSVPHTAELTGIYTAPNGPNLGWDKALKKALAGCFAIGAKYLGMTTSALNGRGGVQWIAWQRDEAFWSVGDRSTRCYLGPYPTRKIKGSIKGRRPPL